MITDDAADPNLDRLRCAALALLVVYHVSFFLPTRGGLHDALLSCAHAGWIGTDLFLALAGFLCVRSVKRARAAGLGPGRSLLRRALRTLPAYYAFLLFYLHVVPAAAQALHVAGADAVLGGNPIAPGAELALFTLTSNLYFAAGHPIGHALEPLFACSLGAQLVVGWTLVLFVLPQRHWFSALLVAWLVACGLRVHWYGGWPWRAYASTLTRVDAFVWGAAFAHAASTETAGAWLRVRAARLWLGSSVLLAAAFLLGGHLNTERFATTAFGYPLVGLWCAALVSWLALYPYKPALGSYVQAVVPMIFCIYLFKLPVIHELSHVVIEEASGASVSASSMRVDTQLLLSSAALAGLLGALWYRLVQRPVQGLVLRATGADAASR